MKYILTTILTFLCLNMFSQTPSPWIDEFTSLSQPGDKFRLVTGQPNTGAHGGFLCYNLSGNYLDGEYYYFESEPLDLSLWTQVDVEFTIASNVRNNDIFSFWYYDPGTGWNGYNLSNLTGTYTITIPNTATLLSFDLDATSGTGNINNKYAHADRIVLSDPGMALPVTLLYFDGKTDNGANIFNWATASEQNSDYFNLEWSENAENWTVIGTVNAAGNSNMNLYYSFIEPCPLPIVNYYRLAQYDWDGQFEMFDIIAIDNRKPENRVVKYVDLSGRVIDPRYTTGFVIAILEDGSTMKTFLKK